MPPDVILALGLLILLLSIAAKPSPSRRLFFLPILFLYTQWHHATIPGPVLRHFRFFAFLSKGAFTPTLLMASDYILLTNVQLSLRKHHDPIGRTYPERLRWAFSLLSTYRGIGWQHESPTSHFPSPGSTRTTYVVHLLKLVLLADLVETLAAIIPAFAHATPIGDQSVLWMCASALVITLDIMIFMTVPYVVFWRIIMGDMHSPDVYGKWSDAYSLRRLWGQTWHQSIRRPVSAHGRFIAHTILRAPKGSMQSSYAQLFIAFLCSGIMHQLHNSAVLGGAQTRVIILFLLQAIGISMEDGIIYAAKRWDIQFNAFWRCVGYMWVACWLTMSFPYWLDAVSVNGHFQSRGGPLTGWILDV